MRKAFITFCVLFGNAGQTFASETHSHSTADMSSSMSSSMSSNMSSSNNEMAPSPMSMNSHASHGRPILQDPNLEPQQRKYWELYNTTTFFTATTGSKPLLYTHSLLTILAWAGLYPICMVIASDSKSQWLYVPLQTLTVATAVSGLVSYWMYLGTAPELYAGNIYGTYTFVLICVLLSHYVLLLVKSVSKYMTGGFDGAEYVLAGLNRPSNDSGHGLTSSEDEFQTDCEAMKYSNRGTRNSKIIANFANYSFLSKLSQTFGSLATKLHSVLTYLLFFGGIGELLIGIAVSSCMGKGKNIFGLLAHFIKGMVFFLLGFVELARYFGWLSKFGMAWNEIDPMHYKTTKGCREDSLGLRLLKRCVPENITMEYIQSAVILFYGSTNIFLEHLGNKDGGWSHKDLQHASIAFMFIGGGFMGLVVESKTIRNFLDTAYLNDSSNSSTSTSTSTSIRTFNPMPAFTIFWTGALMSRHQQETALATSIHAQWGTLLSLAAVLRMATFVLFFLRQNNANALESDSAYAPQRPFTELLVSFCLICGGMIFMLSNRETVEAMIYRGIDSMFTLNVSVGVTTLLMSHAAIVCAIKGFALRRGSQ